jgi:hypothetical protein
LIAVPLSVRKIYPAVSVHRRIPTDLFRELPEDEEEEDENKDQEGEDEDGEEGEGYSE